MLLLVGLGSSRDANHLQFEHSSPPSVVDAVPPSIAESLATAGATGVRVGTDG
jgi:hypothetical protein